MAEHAYTDPPVGGRMTAAELRVVREYLGLTGDWLASHLNVNPRTVRAWEQGKHAIPDGVREAIAHLEVDTAEYVNGGITELMDRPDPVVATYRSDSEYRAHQHGVAWPASWHRAVCARIAQEVPGLSIEYWEP